MEDLIDFTPELRAEAEESIRPHRIGPLFTPPSLEGTVQMPGFGGGANWAGAALDPETGVLYVPSFTEPFLARVAQPDPSRSNLRYRDAGSGAMDELRGLPFWKPPYARITAIDLNRGEHAWMKPMGNGPRRHPSLSELKLPALGSGPRWHVLLT